MKKIIYRIFLLSLFFVIAFTIKVHAISDFSYNLDANGNATITAYKGSESNLTIPNIIDGHNVISIGGHAFDENYNSITNGHTINKLVISEGIERIELLAFVNCTNLETVELPESLNYIDMHAFLQCSKLKSINIPSKIIRIQNSTFKETGFTEFKIPENVTSLDSRVFSSCKNLKKVMIYNDNISFYTICPTYLPDGSYVENYENDNEPFYNCSEDLVLYGNQGSTTEEYAKKKGIKFALLSSSEEPPTTMGSIHLNKNEISLKENESENLNVSFLGISSSTKVIWSSSNEEVAIVENGKVIAKSIGNTIVTASTENGKYKDTCTVSVIKKDNSEESTLIPITSISLNKSSILLYIGNSATLVANILPNDATDKSLVWSSSNEKVVSVENGKIIAKDVGYAIITVSNKDGTKKATCNATVRNKASSPGSISDNTVAVGQLPQAGSCISIIISVITIILITIIMYIKFKSYKDIK